MNRIFRSAVFYLVLIVLVIWVFNMYRGSADKPEELPSVNAWVERVESGQIDTAQFQSRDEKVVGDLANDEGKYELYLPTQTIDEYQQLAIENEVQVSADPQQSS